MGDLIRIDSVIHEREREERGRMAESLRELAKSAERGDLKAVAFVCITASNDGLSIGVLKNGEANLHEIVGATTILSDYLRKTVLE